MYSMVLLMAMSGQAAEAPSWGHHHSCGGCAGCAGSAGSSAGHGWGGHHGGGCCGGVGHSVHGGGSAWVGYGPIAYYGFAGCYGSCYGTYTNYFSYWSMPPQVHYGYGMPMHAIPPQPPPAPPPGKPPVEEKKKEKTDDKAKIGLNSAPANVVVSLPAGAALFANGQRTSQTSAERRFVTPTLPAGESFRYIFTAEVERDGRMVTETKEVEVMAGGTTRVEFDLGAARVATK